MHPLSLRRLLLQRLPLLLSLQALGISVPKVWVLCVRIGDRIVPRQEFPVCLDEFIAQAHARELTKNYGVSHVAVEFKMMGGGLLG